MGSPRYGDLAARAFKGRIAAATATTTTLKALPADSESRADGAVTVVLADSSMWVFDLESAAGASATVLVPDAGSGRFLKAVEAAGGVAADLVTLTDAGGFTSAADVEAGTAEIFQHIKSVSAACVPLPVDLWREVDASGDYANIAGNGGILASDTTPILRADAAESAEISWATGNVDSIQRTFMVPPNADLTALATLELDVYSGATDAATFTVETSWDGGAKVSDSASDAGTKSATPHTITATIAAADIPDTARRCTITLTPTNAHAADAYQLLGANLLFKGKALTA